MITATKRCCKNCGDEISKILPSHLCVPCQWKPMASVRTTGGNFCDRCGSNVAGYCKCLKGRPSD